MTLREAEDTRLHWGVHENRTLGEIARREVSYLDFLLGTELQDTWLTEAVGIVAAKHGRHAKRGSRATGGPKQMKLF